MTDAAYLDRLDSALAQLADIIESAPQGDLYWPIFDRLERERESAGGRAQRLAAARHRVNQARQGQRAA